MESTSEGAAAQSTEGGSGEPEVFSIGAVSHLTGLSEATLRVWELRYHFPKTGRSAGGHRQYRQQDLIELQWVKSRLDDGMRAHRAIKALGEAQHMPRAQVYEVSGQTRAPSVSAPVLQEAGPTALRRPLLHALLLFDAEASDRLLDEAATHYPLEQVVLELIGPILSDIGEAWSNGRIDVATEHFATHRLRQRLAVWLDAHPPAMHVRPVALVCAPGELHEGSLLMLGVLLGRLRWPILYLGQSLPLEDLAAVVANVRPAVIVFVAMTQDTAHALKDWPRWLAPSMSAVDEPQPVVCYGGAAFSANADLIHDVPGLWLGATIGEGSQRIHRLLLDTNVAQQ